MNTTPNAAPPMLQTESPTSYRSNELEGANTQGPSALRLALHADPSMPPAAYDWRTNDPLDPRQPLPEMWCSMPQTSLQPEEVLHPDFLSNSATAGNYGSAFPDGELSPGRSLVVSERDPSDPLIASSQVDVRVFPCLFIQLEHSSGDTYVHPDAPGPGRLKLISRPSELEHWLGLVRRQTGPTQAARSPGGGEDPQIHHDTLIPPAQRDTRAGFYPSSVWHSPASAPSAAQSSSSGWHQGPAFSPQPSYPGPQTPMSAAPPMSVPALPPSPRFNQGPVPRSSYSGPSDSQCAPAATSIPAASHYHDAAASLTRPPPPIPHMANLDPSRSAVHPHAFYPGSAPSMDNRVPTSFDDSLAHLPTVPRRTFATRGTAPVYPVQGQPPPAALTHWPMGEHERMHQPHGRGRS